MEAVVDAAQDVVAADGPDIGNPSTPTTLSDMGSPVGGTLEDPIVDELDAEERQLERDGLTGLEGDAGNVNLRSTATPKRVLNDGELDELDEMDEMSASKRARLSSQYDDT